MAKVFHSNSGTSTQGVGLTRYLTPGTGRNFGDVIEGEREVRFRLGGTLADLLINVFMNGVSAASTLSTRVNNLAGNQSLSIPASTTGVVEDTTNSDSISVADDVAYEMITGAGGTPLGFSISTTFDASANTVQKVSSSGGSMSATGERFFSLHGTATSGTIEANVQFEVNGASTFRNMYVSVASNDRAVSTVALRINGADGNLSVSIGASATGVFEDTASTDSIVANDLLNVRGTGGAGNFLALDVIAFESVSTDDSFHLGHEGGIAISVIDDRFAAPGGQFNNSRVGADYGIKPRFAISVSNFGSDHSINGRNSATVVSAQRDGTDELSYSVPASTTGRFEDTDSVSWGAQEELRYLVAIGASTSGSFRPGPMGCMITTAAAVAAVPFPILDFGLIKVPGRVLAY